ncbi:Uncharacterized protein PECH_007244 [Penicillium ucsense]|uniref:MobA-like NTP transferase domain-containing protein n=1 Tax=Penicillium ucsense TaxID=2839758 RepID=A0A8J8VX54_9EURO|nr:Uncharacterized protein PECM_001747 [Penicillium ucsense]KAF7735076.1 Uncharacterized protein PECH_007244 [Penicillium ucsense]
MTTIQPLLLAGGHSSRMGQRKELLILPDKTPLFIRMITLLHESLPQSEQIYISLRDRQKLHELHQCCPALVRQITPDTLHIFLPSLAKAGEPGIPIAVRILFDEDLANQPGGTEEIGPAKGLLRARQEGPESSWLVVACDYPLLCQDALDQLLQQHEKQQQPAAHGLEKATVFQNADGFAEPLLGIWTPGALEDLSRAVAKGITGPSYVVRHSGSTLIRPRCEKWLVNVNTPEEWEDVTRELETSVEGQS